MEESKKGVKTGGVDLREEVGREQVSLSFGKTNPIKLHENNCLQKSGKAGNQSEGILNEPGYRPARSASDHINSTV
jgi:hypothetical protein